MRRYQQVKLEDWPGKKPRLARAELKNTDKRREEHVNWEQENKEEDSGAIGTDQVWWNSHEERQSLAWVTPAGPKVMRKEREEQRHRDGEKKERYKTLARAFVKPWEHWEGLCFICGLQLLDWLLLYYILSLWLLSAYTKRCLPTLHVCSVSSCLSP